MPRIGFDGALLAEDAAGVLALDQVVSAHNLLELRFRCLRYGPKTLLLCLDRAL